MNEKYFTLSDKFSDILVAVYKDLIKELVSCEEFYIYLMGISCNMQLGTLKRELKQPRNWIEMFQQLSSIRAWDFLNYRILREMVTKYLKESTSYSLLKKQLEEYDSEVEAFLHSTKLLEFLDVHKELCPDDLTCKESIKILKAKITGDLSQMTLAEFHVRRGYLVGQFQLQNYALNFATANPGCVILYWYIPECLDCHIRKVYNELQPDLGQAGVIELSIDDGVLYQVSIIILDNLMDKC